MSKRRNGDWGNKNLENDDSYLSEMLEVIEDEYTVTEVK
jgi:hypothetical protein